MRARALRRASRWLFAILACIGSCSARQQSGSEVGRQVAEHLCPVQRGCDCDERLLIEDCEATVEREIARHEHEAIESGLVFDAECLDAFLAHIDEIASCISIDQWSSPPSPQECSVYSGTVEIGGPCTNYEFYPPMTDCQQGLVCQGGKCRNVNEPEILQEGEPCQEGWVSLGECAEGLACDTLDTDTCILYEPLPMFPIGHECRHSAECEPGSYCRPMDGVGDPSDQMPGVCTAYTPAGEACSLFYECDWWCEDGVCQYPPTALCVTLGSWHDTRGHPSGSAEDG